MTIQCQGFIDHFRLYGDGDKRTPVVMFNKNTFLRHAVVLALLLGLATSTCFAEATRIAVIGDPTLGDLVDLTTAQLSTVPDVSIIERSDLNKIGHEQALKDIVGSNDLSSVQFVPADGLVILRAVKQDGKTGIFARLVAVQPGIVLRELALSDGGDAAAHAGEIEKEFAPYWPKLAQIQTGKITALSLLGLRFEVDGPEARAMERKINLLLAIRLSAEPDTVVLERWRLNDALFEKSITAQPAAPFWTGSSLIDGSMKWENKLVRVNMRIRPSNGAEVSASDQDSAEHLSALVDHLANKIQAHPMTQAAWQPAAEAAHYAELGKWCLDNRLTEEGTEALESALALGDGSAATHRLQIRAYASLAYTDELPDADSDYIPEAPVVNPVSLPDRVKWGTTAADLAGRYWSANLDFSGQPGTAEDPVAVSLPVLNNCLRLLRFAYQQGYAWSHPDETADLRHSVQGLISQMEPVLAKRPEDQRDLFLTYQIRYAAFWHETPEATVDFYRGLLNRQADGVFVRAKIFEDRYTFLHPPVLLPEEQEQAERPGDTLLPGSWESGAPRLITWENRPSADIAGVWQNFLQELSASPDPVLRADELKFELGPSFMSDEQYDDAKEGRLVAFLQQNRDNLVGERGDEILTGFGWTYSHILGSNSKANLEALRAFGADLLNQRVVLPVEWFRWMTSLYYKIPEETARPLLTRLDGYHQWYQSQSPQDPKLIEALEHARATLAFYAGATSEGLGSHFLTVNRHWPAQLAQNLGPHFGPVPFPPSVITAENKAWFLMFGGKQIHCVDTTNFENDSVFTIPDEFRVCDRNTPGGVCLGVTPQYLVVCVYGRVLLCSRADSTWRALDLPPSDYKPCWINQQLYLLYDVEADLRDFHTKGQTPAAAISGLIHVSLPDGGIENLVSTRRIPPQTPLDGKPLGFPLGLWNSPAGLMLAVNAESPPFQVFGAPLGTNAWALVTSDTLTCDVKPGTSGELVGKGFDDHGFAQLALLNGADNPVLLSNPSRVPAGANQLARWDLPGEFQNPPPGDLLRASAAMRGDDLCLYRVMVAGADNLQGCLYYFTKGQKAGLRIPLKFEAPGIQNPTMIKCEPYLHNFQSLQATDYGLVMVQEMGGFWVIPWSDIDAYRAHAGSDSVATASPTPSDLPPNPVPPPTFVPPVTTLPPPAVAPSAVIAPAAAAPPVLVSAPPPPPLQAKAAPPVMPSIPEPSTVPARSPAPSATIDNRD